MIVKVRLIEDIPPLEITKKGDWIDLRAASNINIEAPTIHSDKTVFRHYLISLGIAMALPKGYEAILAPRSSTFKTYGIIAWNSIGIIDNSYSGNNDIWRFGAIGLKNGEIRKGDRICQFRIQLSQKATMWQKVKWFLTGGKIKFCYVNDLHNTDRNGFGKGTGSR